MVQTKVAGIDSELLEDGELDQRTKKAYDQEVFRKSPDAKALDSPLRAVTRSTEVFVILPLLKLAYHSAADVGKLDCV